MGRGSGQKFRVKWTNLTEELILEYGANHSLFRDPSKQRPQKSAENPLSPADIAGPSTIQSCRS